MSVFTKNFFSNLITSSVSRAQNIDQIFLRKMATVFNSRYIEREMK